MSYPSPPMDFAGSVLLILLILAVGGFFLVSVSMLAWQQLIAPAAVWLLALFH